MQVTVNGRAIELPTGCTVSRLLEEVQQSPTRVAVECNEELVLRREYGARTLCEGDRIEIVTFVGGGA